MACMAGGRPWVARCRCDARPSQTRGRAGRFDVLAVGRVGGTLTGRGESWQRGWHGWQSTEEAGRGGWHRGRRHRGRRLRERRHREASRMREREMDVGIESERVMDVGLCAGRTIHQRFMGGQERRVEPARFGQSEWRERESSGSRSPRVVRSFRDSCGQRDRGGSPTPPQANRRSSVHGRGPSMC